MIKVIVGMDLEQVINVIEDVDVEIDLFFTEKSVHGYSSFQADINAGAGGRQVIENIKNLVSGTIQRINTEHFDTVQYNPTGVVDGTLEVTNHDYVESYNEIMDSYNDVETENLEENADNLTFYTLFFRVNDQEVKIMRRVSKFKRLSSKGVIATFTGNAINSIDSKMIGIDGAVDLIDYNDEILVINHISIERIFNMDNKFSETATTMLQQLSNNDKIGNFNTFEEDCLNDKRIQKTLTKMASEEIDWEHCLDRFENVVNIIDTFDLDIDYQRAPQEQVNYDNKGQLMDFVRLIRDAYYKTMINEQIGVDNGI